MKQSSWEKFNWVRMGESGGNREGYSPEIFKNMSPTELSEARDLLIKDDFDGDVFALEGLCYASPEEAKKIIRQQLSNTHITTFQEIHLLCWKAYLEDSFSPAKKIIGYISEKNEKIKAAAITGLRTIANIIPDDDQTLIAKALISEKDPTTRAKISELIKFIHKDKDEFLMLNFQFAKEENAKKRKELLIKYKLI